MTRDRTLPSRCAGRIRKFRRNRSRQRCRRERNSRIFAGKERNLKLFAEGADNVPLCDKTQINQDAAEFFVTFLLKRQSVLQIFIRRSGRDRAAIDPAAGSRCRAETSSEQLSKCHLLREMLFRAHHDLHRQIREYPPGWCSRHR